MQWDKKRQSERQRDHWELALCLGRTSWRCCSSPLLWRISFFWTLPSFRCRWRRSRPWGRSSYGRCSAWTARIMLQIRWMGQVLRGAIARTCNRTADGQRLSWLVVCWSHPSRHTAWVSLQFNFLVSSILSRVIMSHLHASCLYFKTMTSFFRQNIRAITHDQMYWTINLSVVACLIHTCNSSREIIFWSRKLGNLIGKTNRENKD